MYTFQNKWREIVSTFLPTNKSVSQCFNVEISFVYEIYSFGWVAISLIHLTIYNFIVY